MGAFFVVEPLLLDEAYLDVTENLHGITSATKIAEQIRERIWAETRLTASAGVLQQIPGEACFGPPQARWSICHHARDGARFH